MQKSSLKFLLNLTLLLLLSNSVSAGMLGELPKYVPAVNVTPTFSIYSSTTKERLF